MSVNPGGKLGPYTIVALLAEGGMAELYLARNMRPGGFDLPCVVKLVKEEFRRDPKYREMFVQEAALCARLQHENIVRIYDFNADGGELFIVMELVDGSSVEALRTGMPH